MKANFERNVHTCSLSNLSFVFKTVRQFCSSRDNPQPKTIFGQPNGNANSQTHLFPNCRLLSRGSKPASSDEDTSASQTPGLEAAEAAAAPALEFQPTVKSDGEDVTSAPDGVGSTVATVLTWQNLSVFAGQKKILDDVSGYAQPGELLAIMGASGRGIICRGTCSFLA